MKKNMIKVMAAAMLAAVALAGCTKSELVCDAADSKDIVITANRAAKDAFVLSGSLEVAEGETIRIKPELSRGAVMIELIAEPEEQSMEELPDTFPGISGSCNTICILPSSFFHDDYCLY